jgi:hypothetical protein
MVESHFFAKEARSGVPGLVIALFYSPIYLLRAYREFQMQS